MLVISRRAGEAVRFRLPDGRVGNFMKNSKRPIRDDIQDQAPHGSLNMERGLIVSCNAFFAQLGAYDVGAEPLLDTANMLGIAAAAPASNRDRPRPSPIFFSLGAGHGALGRVDLSTCRDRGLPAGYLRIRATFRPSGHVAHAAVESAAEPPQEALECVSEQLEDTSVPPFDGEDVSLSKIVFVN